MGRDVKRAKRIAAVIGLVERVGRRDLMESTRMYDDAKRTHDEVLESLVADEFLSGPFVDLVARRLPRLAVEVGIQDQRRTAALRIWQGHQMRAVASNRLVDDAQLARDREREGKELETLLEVLHGRQAQGSGKSGE